MNKRDKFPTRSILLVGSMQKETARLVLENVPVDMANPLEFIIREQVKIRKPDQNSLMWSGPLVDIQNQAYVEGRTYSAEVWHETFKREYLPEEFDPELCKEGYLKWDYTPNGERILIGSTTQLTIKGFAIYLEQIMAYAGNLGVMFHASPRDNMS
jgi:hypothetical protein